jgi:hypothetical protein
VSQTLGAALRATLSPCPSHSPSCTTKKPRPLPISHWDEAECTDPHRPVVDATRSQHSRRAKHVIPERNQQRSRTQHLLSCSKSPQQALSLSLAH